MKPSLEDIILKIETNLGPVNKECIFCGKPLTYKQILKKSYPCQYIGPNITCGSKECCSKKNKQTCLARYGVQNAAKTEESKRKQVETQIKRYDGITGYCMNNNREKQKKTCFEKYGVEKYSQQKDFSDKIRSNNQYINRNITDDPIKYFGKNIISRKEFNDALINANCHQTFFNYVLRNYNILVKDSFRQNGEREIYEYILQLGIDRDDIKLNRNCFLENRLQLDIFVKSLNLGIEFNGDFWHQISRLKNYNKQLLKTELSEKNNIRLIHIWQSDWKNNQEYCKYVIKCYLDGKIPDTSIYNNRLPRDYFQTLDFPGSKIEEPIIEKSGEFDVYKTGYIIL